MNGYVALCLLDEFRQLFANKAQHFDLAKRSMNTDLDYLEFVCFSLVTLKKPVGVAMEEASLKTDSAGNISKHLLSHLYSYIAKL